MNTELKSEIQTMLRMAKQEIESAEKLLEKNSYRDAATAMRIANSHISEAAIVSTRFVYNNERIYRQRL